MKRVLFISHDAYCAGATLLLMQFLGHVKKNRSFEFDILIKRGHGKLIDEFNALAPTFVWNRPAPKLNRIAYALFKKAEKRRQQRISHHFQQTGYDVIFSNTITNGELLDQLSFLNTPVITHVHELGYWIDKCGISNLAFIKQHTHRYVAVSKAVRRYLISSCGIPESRIDLSYGCTDVAQLKAIQDPGGLKRLLELAPTSMIVASCGDEIWRKGKDLFVPMASRVLRRSVNNVHFVWIGGKVTNEIIFDLKQSGFSDRIHFLEFIPNAKRYFCDIDIFAMLSRDDPFPVVNLETGALGKPIVCFAESGGTPELLEELPENIVPYLDVGRMSDRILELIDASESSRNKVGEQLAAKTSACFDLNIYAERLINLIEQGCKR